MTELPYTWEFWVIKSEGSDYEIEPIVSFSTVEEFWQYYLQFPGISEVKRGGIGLFRKGIAPAWEDPQNASGCAVRFNEFDTRKENWEHLVLAVVGGTIESKVQGAPFCGLYAVWRPGRNRLTLELWFGRGSIQEREVAAALGITPKEIAIKYHRRM
jgi:hypothetical protein